MGEALSLSFPADKAVVTLLHILAMSSTVYRLVHRFKIRMIWWDDYLSFVPGVVDIFYSISIWSGSSQTTSSGSSKSTNQLFDSYWFSTFPCLIILWTSRTVLALSIARVFPSKHPARRWSFVLIALMGISFVACIIVTITACKHASALMSLEQDTGCIGGVGATPLKDLFMSADDILGDALLIIAPLVFFWRIKLHPTERRLILIVFCGSALTLLVSIIFVILAMTGTLSGGSHDLSLVNTMAHVEAASAILVSNLVVVATCLYQFIRYGARPERQSTTETRGSRSSRSYSRSRCSCAYDSQRSLTPITLTEISEFSSAPPSQQTHSSFNTDLHPLRCSDSQVFYSTSESDIHEMRRSMDA